MICKVNRMNSHSIAVFAVAASLTLSGIARAEERKVNTRKYPPQLPGSKVETYKTVGDVELKMWILNPQDHARADKRSAIVFFFGGGWRSGNPAQFYYQGKHLASRGMVVFLADYRVSSRHGVKPMQCVSDAKSAIRWVRKHAQRLGVDPDRIVAAGGSAGGHLAAATGTLEEFDEPTEDRTVSSQPNAMALFNPASVIGPVDGKDLFKAEIRERLDKATNGKPHSISPYHHVRKGLPPAIVFHGKADTTVPYETAELFTAKMKQAGNRCELEGYEGEAHGFFNHGRGGNKMFDATLKKLDEFLVSIKFLEG